MDMNVGLIEVPITVHSPGSSFTASHMAARRLGGYSLIEWLVRRIRECESLHRILVFAHDPDHAPELVRLVPPDVPVVIGEGRDTLARCRNVAVESGARSLVRIRLDQPFTDPALIDGLAAAARRNPAVDYVGYASRAGLGGSELRCVGLFAEWCSTEALERADLQARAAHDRAHLTRYIIKHPGAFHLAWLSPPAALDRDDLRLILDRADDWDHVHDIVEALGHDSFDWQSVVELLELQAEMRGRMARLNSSSSKTVGLTAAAAD